MKSWSTPAPAPLPVQPDRLRVFDTASQSLRHPGNEAEQASLYVCGITPYDATHLGHATTYVSFDLLQRYWRAAGLEVSYTQNVTDVDDPLLERAEATGVDWRALAEDQTELFRTDMAALNVLAPDHYVGATEAIGLVVDAVQAMLADGTAYRVPGRDGEPDGDVYFDVRAAEARGGWRLGEIGALSPAEMAEVFPERGGDPDRPGKRDPLDPLLWRVHRDGEPAWDGRTLGQGRPGWHIECSVIAREHLPAPFTVQGGGSDLRFPHHEFSAAHATAVDGRPLARTYLHSGMVALDGQKMSKSLGNLELVSRLRARGVEPVAIRAALLDRHYRSDWEWSEDLLAAAQERVARWRAALDGPHAGAGRAVLAAAHAALSEDLDAPAALRVLDAWAAGELTGEAEGSGEDPLDLAVVADALLGLVLR
ncbi:cysteine--1-D-myo-inosityl 2-amino-2-deoxy-alpha-D-glucopyranoside ligase [Micrococcus flavus]|uniref:L-cysteine:1D-myo-inositol 2-amino-2-deoxy-alpha-D-glucopyranoside ligase n=1 Tax=Micrococcus flavus TaxID=384602 RepID=A0A4Y8X366_9MICC|nr:cysteine--1-D-myo-inosityl 2-amino-2-deoxy-alpha-D-glucopyranoside ligase [Micrococcus flavus]MBB4882664.1 L-cysteine:1D-myo-inositol 2-amino-2-deoxy-alpha-D-glucopyranoside ligase [Micrococcus flavus]TFI04133.1 cysteine--1-D-myo-inosityl 2-amino-2-deoxy-alpha-D-glucopyranoside ligase [Micrococcus flavus]GGK39213.1 L-cysteine:1D-myo-inositol 2-amino-2-deoxy-alpha-D-glucopyranoside ligase [Micrococcus flavus]